MENDDVSALPEGFLARSFYRQYASYLGLPEKEVTAALGGMFSSEAEPCLPGQEPRKGGSGLPPLPKYAEPRVQPRKVISALAALVVVAAGCGVAYQLWQNRDAGPEPAAIVRMDTAAPVARPVSETEGPGYVRPQPEGPLWIELEADEEVWVEITAGGERVFSGLLQRSETKQLTGLEEARVKVGNAGGLRILWNGKPVGPIGPSGQIRVVRLTPEGLSITNPRAGSPKPVGAALPSSQT